MPYRIAAEYAKKNNFGLMEVSAKTGHGVKDAFGRLIMEIHRQVNEEEDEFDPDQPKLLYTTGNKTSLNGRDEIYRNSLVLEAGNYFGGRKNSANTMSPEQGSARHEQGAAASKRKYGKGK